ncbi:MAG: acyltransferase [Caulobacteraceae bacterium]|nr:acyltransferase [Caulobacteraceae bacterium]
MPLPRTPAAEAVETAPSSIAQARAREALRILRTTFTANAPPPATKARNPALDGLRALAALSVLFMHARLPGFAGGERGVDVFFVLSGYVITRLLRGQVEQDGEIDMAAFWAARTRRLAPALLVVVAVYVALAPILWAQYAPMRWRDGALAISYLMDYGLALGQPASPLTPTWSLAIEAQFYLLWPLVLPFIMRRRSPLLVLLAIWVASTQVRDLLVAHGIAGPAAYYPLHMRATGLVLGGVLAFAPRRIRGLGPLALMGLAAIMAFGGARDLWTVTATELLTALLIMDLEGDGLAARALAWEPLRQLGVISYAIYLWHSLVIAPIAGLAPVEKAPIALAVTIGLATLSWFTVERWGKRAFKSTIAAAAT